ncbi:uncharacterized protein LOC117648342 [Thrips palmi]|uniref:Uncharacterized protein LOC117648342 n=1 Tax=Thrips palmi TaxID=161013 RepID=A0A6P8ZCT1_THRPL|nr:uncharacterized protein LOC117648342 [Thrips palmi]XP_034246727.1 uncharacterized protein LOC117648342 [Thrips palmi]
MECPVCCEAWDLQEVRPKVLPCSHSVCATCLKGLRKRRCPTCREAFADPVADNHSLIAVLESTSGLKKPLMWWCLDCQSVSSPQCLERQHNVKRPKAVLRRGLQDLVARCSQHLEELQDGVQGMKDSAAVKALQLLDVQHASSKVWPATCKLYVCPDASQTNRVACQWHVGGQDAQEDLTKALVMVLASGRCPVQQPMLDEAPAKRKRTDECVLYTHSQESRFEEPDVKHLGLFGPDQLEDEKAEALLFFRQHSVRRLSVRCDSDPIWSLEVLNAAAPAVQELELLIPRAEHLASVQAMPHLRRLHISNAADFDIGPAVPPKLPAPSQSSSARWLRVKGFDRAATQGLLRLYAASLKVLWLEVAASPRAGWPKGCSDLDAFLRPCGLKQLSRLVLLRIGCDSATCRAQLAAARRVLPAGCKVQCDCCDGVPREAF